MTFTYPKPELKLHKRITEKLLDGVFIFIGSSEYDVLSEYETWYKAFFKESFNIDLVKKHEIFYCESLTKKTDKTKNIMVFIAILMYELSNKGKEPISTIQTSEFTLDEIRSYLADSVQFSNTIDIEKYGKRFFNELHNFGIIRKIDENRFVFTKAVDIFLDEYQDLIEQLDLNENGSVRNFVSIR